MDENLLSLFVHSCPALRDSSISGRGVVICRHLYFAKQSVGRESVSDHCSSDDDSVDFKSIKDRSCSFSGKQR